MLIEGRDFFCSWSGGKDSCLALHRAMELGGRPRVLLTMLVEDGSRSRSHGLSVNLLRTQASRIGAHLDVRKASWSDYESVFVSAMKELAAKGIVHGVFGDIDMEEHKEWVERACGLAGTSAHEPLWKGKRMDLLREFLDHGFSATIVAVKEGTLDKGFLGRRLDWPLVEEFEAIGVDVSGEKGEYHTVVTEGPIFSNPIRLVDGEALLRDGYWFLDVDSSDWPDGWGGVCHA